MKKFIPVSLVIGICVGVFYFTNTPQIQIKNTLQNLKKAAEQKNILKCSGYISKNYTDSDGFSYESLLFAGKEVFRTYEKILIQLENITITAKKNTASVNLQARIYAQETGKTEFEDLLSWRDGGEFRLTIIKESGKWKIVRAENPNNPDPISVPEF